MSWRDQLRPASFRGVPFFWQTSDTKVGRKTGRHDYPDRDDCKIEDLGKAPREFTLEAIVLGPDYMAARDALIDALETAGDGELIHPLYGRLQVAVPDPARVRETTAEGGMAKITITFVVAGAAAVPTVTVDTAAKVSSAAKEVIDTDQPRGTDTDTRLDLASRFVSICTSVTARIEGAGAAVSAWVRDLERMQQSLTTLVASPAQTAQAMVGLITGVAGLVEAPLDALALYDDFLVFGLDDAAWPRATAGERNQADTRDSMVAQTQLVAIAAAARLASTIDFVSYQDATAVRDRLIAHLDRMLAMPIVDAVGDFGAVWPEAGEYALTDDTWALLSELRVAVILDLDTRGANLARVVPWTPPVTLPVLVIAHRLYGDATRADEIVARNRIVHPGFVPGGRPIEVLTNA